MRRRVIRLEDGKIVADEERGYYLQRPEGLAGFRAPETSAHSL